MNDDDWQAIESAPPNTDLELRVKDDYGSYQLKFLCRLTKNGWINGEIGLRLATTPVGWRYPQGRKDGAGGPDEGPKHTRGRA